MTRFNEQTDRENVSIITESMSVTGNIKSDSLIVLEGKVKGNITTSDNIETFVSSFVEGDIKANSAMLGGEVKGNINCESSVSIDINTKITGDVDAYDIKIAGKVVGNVTARNSVSLKENAVVEGNVSCVIVSIEAGAKIDGNFKMIKAEEPQVPEVNEDETEDSFID